VQRIWLREAIDVDGFPVGKQLRTGGAEASMVELEHVEDQLALFLVHMNRI